MTRSDLVGHWQRLTAPDNLITDPNHRQQSQLLASLMLAMVLIGLLSSPLFAIFNPGARWAQVQVVIGLVNTLLAYVAYRMARVGDYRLASSFIALFGSVMIVVGAFLGGGDPGLHVLYYLTFMTLFASMFLPMKFVIGITLLQNLAILGYGWLGEGASTQSAINGPFLFNLLFAAALLVIVWHRKRLDADHRTRLAESETRYRTVADLASDFAYSCCVEPGGVCVLEWMTDSFFELTGYSRDDLKTRKDLWYYHPDDQDAAKMHQQAVARGESRCDEYRLIANDGSERWIQVARRPILDESGSRVEHIFGVAEDITERKQAEEQQLEMAVAKVRSELLYGFFRQVAHDFRTSLTVIETSRYMINQLLQRGQQQQVEEQLDTIARQVNRLNQQIENLRVVSLLTNPTTEPCDLNRISRAEIDDHKGAMAEKKIEFAFVPDPGVPPVHAHPKELQRAIRLLLENAIEYTECGGAISLRVSHEGGLALLEVSDTGIGIAPDDEERIFEFFYRAENAVTHEPDGYGLGLSIARMIAEAYGGEIEVESQPDEGSTFKMMIPTLQRT